MTQVLTRAILDAKRFPQHQLDALFAAVLIDDEVDDEIILPRHVPLYHEEAVLLDCFRICRQLCIEGVPPAELAVLLAQVERDGDLDAGARLCFKHLRAKLKHFRFARALYSADHRYAVLTDWLTTALGHVQDAFKTGQRARARRKARVAALFLLTVPWAALRHQQDRLVLTDSAGFRAYLARETARLSGALVSPTVTGAQFHALRKVASRQVSFYDTLRTIQPSEEAFRMSRALAAINGLMGTMHDDLVERRSAGVQDYYRERFALPADIRDRIDALVGCYRSSGLSIPNT